MKIEHVAIWTKDIENMRAFYENYFAAKSGNKYRNSKKNFESYFLTFHDGARLELMANPDVKKRPVADGGNHIGLIHMAMSLGSKKKVDELTVKLHNDGYPLLDGPRTTGDGYYESVILDPEGNRLELTI
ncbi:VOC family protein [Salisediminibacterium halotolerans]|uniref:Lactoylglutathione lyase n=1 Tax=Salisediminibacterium halotolerans TaxID=517425 RepID=A0A1H9W7Q5_9BACI|nr:MULTISPECIES: VOC family protein [Salisediminibacterium]RLJ69695.1 lactoylglutathione lyase [Actinophytocola xinjiangensis]RPE89753.1 lactoylglutathione lyase [Salisediminibacterium halotolerans]TWG32589.1 lactoylglutathione lyase [Salisediminibacterium halotolerans]SES29799.1 lactoylglutathione lyase [Salisediminibacterium haloalkalitolerans]GEL08088.1 hypothetical protein SHA02_15040 [Salisediminibacterium halotolerans]